MSKVEICQMENEVILHMDKLISVSAKIIRVTSITVSNVWKGFTTMAVNSENPRILKKIGTHDGVFHCDEALACYMLKQTAEYVDAEIVRTRDPKLLADCDIVVDVGGVYNSNTNRYDHHQKDFNATISTVCPGLIQNKHIKLSSAGLVFAHFGLDVFQEIIKRNKVETTPECIPHMFVYVYETFVEELDAIDNGVPMFVDGKPKYRINTHLSARVHRLNPEWNSPNPVSTNEMFFKAMELVGSEFTERVIECATVWWPAREIVQKSISNRKKVYESGEIVLLEERCPWKDHLFALEEEMGISGEIKFVLFHDVGGSWRVQAIPILPDSFICRIFLHKDWRGVRDEELSSVAGIKDCIFCHATGFIGGNKTKEGAMEMALRSLSAPVLCQQ